MRLFGGLAAASFGSILIFASALSTAAYAGRFAAPSVPGGPDLLSFVRGGGGGGGSGGGRDGGGDRGGRDGGGVTINERGGGTDAGRGDANRSTGRARDGNPRAGERQFNSNKQRRKQRSRDRDRGGFDSDADDRALAYCRPLRPGESRNAPGVLIGPDGKLRYCP